MASQLLLKWRSEGFKIASSMDFTFGYVSDKGIDQPSYAHGMLGARSLLRNNGNGAIRQTMRPMCLSINPTECFESMAYICESFKSALEKYEGVPTEQLYFDAYNSDHQMGVIGAACEHLQNPSTTAEVLDQTLDHIHIERTAVTNNTDKLVDKSFADKARHHIYLIHIARSPAQERLMKQYMLQHWDYMGESKLSDWFRRTLLDQKFSVSASGIPGADCDANFHESAHRTDKRDMLGASVGGKKVKVSLGVFMTELAPEQVARHANKRGDQIPLVLGTPDGAPSRFAVQKATMLSEMCPRGMLNYIKVSKGMKLNTERKGPTCPRNLVAFFVQNILVCDQIHKNVL